MIDPAIAWIDRTAGSLAVADPVDGAGEIVGNHERAVLRHQHIVGPAAIFAVGADPPGGEFLLLVRSCRPDRR